MRKLISSGIVFLISVIVLIDSIFLAESYNHALWWQVIGMAIVTLAVGRYHMVLIKEYQKHRKN